MKALGIVRTIDKLGRIVLPADLRKSMDYAIDEPLEIFVEDDKVILKKYNPTCLFCGSGENTVKYKDKLVCAECAKKLSALAEYV
jgi:transcriptional pleiotropic regulator of transition state genes